jgi:hypothetical protein
VGDEVHALGLGLGHERTRDAAVQVLDRDVDGLEGHLARLDLGHVEDVVEQAQKVVARVADDRQIVALGGLEPRSAEQLGGPENAVHRGAQLVRDDAEEAGLGVAGGVGLVAGGLKLLDQVGLMLLEGADPLLAEHGHGHQDEHACSGEGHDAEEGPEQRPAPQAGQNDQAGDAIGRGDDDGLTRRAAQLGEHQHIAGNQQGDGQGLTERLAREPGQQRRGGPGAGGDGGDRREDESPARPDLVGHTLFEGATDGAGGQGGHEPDQRRAPADRAQQTHGPAGDDDITQILGLQDGGQGLGGVTCAIAQSFADAFGSDHRCSRKTEPPGHTLRISV